MSSKTTWILLLLVAAGALYLLVLEDMLGIGTTDERERQSRRLFETRAEDVDTIRISRKGTEIVLKRAPDGWDMIEPTRAFADTYSIDSVLGQLLALEAAGEPQPATADDLERFGFSPADVAVELVGSFGSMTIAVGDETPLGGNHYIRIDDGGLHVVDEKVHGLLDRRPIDWRDTSLFALDPFEAEGLTVSKPDMRIVARAQGNQFTFGDPIVDLADAPRIRSLLYKLSGLDALEFLPAEGRNAAALGLDSPQLVIEVTYPGEEHPERVRIGATASEHPAALYAVADRFPGEIALVPEDTPIDFAGDADSFRAKELLDLGALTVTSLRLGADRSIAGDDIVVEKGRRGWSLIAPVALEAESGVVDALIQALGGIKIRRYVADTIAAAGLQTKRLIELDTDGDPRRFYILGADDEGRFLLVSRTETGPVLAVDIEVLDLLPTDTLDLRSRAVTQVDLWEPLTLTLERSDRTYVVDSENLAFTMREPFAGALDGRVAQELESMLSPLRAATIVAKAADDLTRYGLDAPRVRFTAEVRPSTSPAYKVTLLLGSRDADGNTYGTVDGTSLVFTLSPEQARWFVDEEWRERRLVDAEAHEVTRIRIRDAEGEVHLLHRAGTWDVREPSASRPDVDVIERAAALLAQLTVESFVADPATASNGLPAEELYELRFEIERDADVTEHRIRIAPVAGDDSLFYLLADGAPLATVDAASEQLLSALLRSHRP